MPRWLDVPYDARLAAKWQGAQWDAIARRWFAPDGAPWDSYQAWWPKAPPAREEFSPALKGWARLGKPAGGPKATLAPIAFRRDAMDGKTWLAVPFAEKDWAKACGARWDAAHRRWYVPNPLAASDCARWLPRGADPAEAREAAMEANRIPSKGAPARGVSCFDPDADELMAAFGDAQGLPDPRDAIAQELGRALGRNRLPLAYDIAQSFWLADARRGPWPGWGKSNKVDAFLRDSQQ